jgi:hypothetical protein
VPESVSFYPISPASSVFIPDQIEAKEAPAARVCYLDEALNHHARFNTLKIDLLEASGIEVSPADSESESNGLKPTTGLY